MLGLRIFKRILAIQTNKENKMEYIYEIEYRNQEGDIHSESFTYLPDARTTMQMLEDAGNEITKTWRYVDGEYLGPIPPRNNNY